MITRLITAAVIAVVLAAAGLFMLFRRRGWS